MIVSIYEYLNDYERKIWQRHFELTLAYPKGFDIWHYEIEDVLTSEFGHADYEKYKKHYKGLQDIMKRDFLRY